MKHAITAKLLLERTNRVYVDNIVADLVRTIDTHIATQHAAGFNSIEYELPVVFQINNMSKRDAQIMVYSDLLHIYRDPEPQGKGFEDVRIVLGPRASLRIGWLNGMDGDERKKRLTYIESCRDKST